MKESTKALYSSMVRSAAKNLEELSVKYGIPKDAENLIGVLGMKIRLGYKAKPAIISSANAFLERRLPEIEEAFTWIKLRSIQAAKRAKGDQTTVELLGQLAQGLVAEANKRMASEEDISLIIRHKKEPVRRRAARVASSVTLADIRRIEKYHVIEPRFVVERLSKPVVSMSVAGMYLRPLYLLGMRSVEAMDYEILYARPGISAAQRQAAYADPATGEADRMLLSASDLDGDGLAWKTTMDPSRCDDEEAPLVVKIHSRKKTHLSGDHVKDTRYAILRSIDPYDKEAIFWCSRLRFHFFAAYTGSDLRDTMTGRDLLEGHLKKIRRRLTQMQQYLAVPTFDLTSLRHAFATRCRDSLDHAEAAALLGHSGPRTTRGYGKRAKRWKKKKGSQGGSGWMPTPDPVTVSDLEQYFYPEAASSEPSASLGDDDGGTAQDIVPADSEPTTDAQQGSEPTTDDPQRDLF